MTREVGKKILRVGIYAVSIVGVTVGASLIKTGGLSVAYADGTSAAKIQNGEIIFFGSLIILCGNIMWGILRWFLRAYREGWKAGKIIGGMIGGGAWRTLAIFPVVLVALFLITPAISDLINAKVAGRDVAEIIVPSEPTERLEYVAGHLEDFTAEELEEELEPYLFNNVRFDTDASGNVSTRKSPGLFAENASAFSRSVTTLNKVKLSPSEKFVIFYTDTGDNAIADAKAAELAEMLDDIISRYKNNLGFSYENSVVAHNNAESVLAMKMLLMANDIEPEIIETAMPVYIINPFKNGSRTLAFYTGRKNADLLGRVLISLAATGIAGKDTAEMAWLTNSTPAYPFFTIIPENVNSESLSIISAHELGHHFEEIYGYANNYDLRAPENFINETIANWMAINVFPNRTQGDAINADHYNDTYLAEDMGRSINLAGSQSDLIGYAAVAFLENYAEVVPGARDIIMDADFADDALLYLYNRAGAENFHKVMTNLAEKNLTGDYGGKIINYVSPTGYSPECADFCTTIREISPATTEYLYFATGEYENTEIEFLGNAGETSASILGKNALGAWEVIESSETKIKFEIDEEVGEKYEVIALAIVNYTTNADSSYVIKVAKSEMAEIIDDEGDYDFGEIYGGLGQGCYEIDTDALFDSLMEIANLVGAELAGAESDLAPYKITICGNYIKSGQSFEAVEERLRATIGWNINILDEVDGTNRLSVFAGANLLTREGRVYILGQADGEMGLMTIGVATR